MIRIDLGKAESKKGAGKNPFTGGLKLPDNLKIPNVRFDVKGLLLIGAVTAFAGLPHLFVVQYKSYAESQHQLSLRASEEKATQLQQEIAKFNTYKREMESYEKQKTLVRERLE